MPRQEYGGIVHIACLKQNNLKAAFSGKMPRCNLAQACFFMGGGLFLLNQPNICFFIILVDCIFHAHSFV